MIDTRASIAVTVIRCECKCRLQITQSGNVPAPCTDANSITTANSSGKPSDCACLLCDLAQQFSRLRGDICDDFADVANAYDSATDKCSLDQLAPA